MPLLSDATSLTESQALAVRRQLRDEFAGIIRMTELAPPSIPNPWAVETSARMARAAITLADPLLAEPSPSPERLTAAINLLYEARNAHAYRVRAAKVAPTPLLPPPRPSSPRS